MEAGGETASLVALLRHRRLGAVDAKRLLSGVRPGELLEDELGLLAAEAWGEARAEIEAWRRRGIEVLTPLEPKYPPQLRRAAHPPPLIFVRGDVRLLAEPAVAVVGSRRATGRGLRAADAVARRLVSAGFVVVSGLAAGIDTAAHRAALADAGRTVAVIGTGLDRFYPAENQRLQTQIAASGAVVSQFWPDAGPTRRGFPMRNGLMAAMTAATVIVEASEHSGTRIQARMSLASGRKVLLLAALLERDWARELAARPGVHVVSSASELERALCGPAQESAAA